MVNSIIKNLFRNWHLLRILRLLLGITFIANGIAEALWFMLAIGGFLLYQVVMNVGCSTACAPLQNTKNTQQDIENVDSEEVK